MKAVAFLLLAGSAIHFDITDARGRKASGITIEQSTPDADGWCGLTLAKGKGEPVLVWPFHNSARVPDGPEPVPAIVIQRGDEKALTNLHIVGAIATPVALGVQTLEESATLTGFPAAVLTTAFAHLELSKDPYEQGLGLFLAKKAQESADQFAIALKDRQRQLTGVPSEIYPAAMLYGYALTRAGKFDLASVAFLTASKQRPSDTCAAQARAEALVRSGKPEAAGLLNTGIADRRCALPWL
jgi:hypothetical protein